MRVAGLTVLLLGLGGANVGFATPTIVVEDAPVTVFEHAQQCEPLDLPDAPLRAFRRADGMVVGFATHYLNRSLVGPSLSQLSHDCRLVYQGRHLEDPSKFDDRTWITATWTADGVRVAGLGHNEFHAHDFPGRCKFQTDDECWYTAVVPLISSDGGRSFVRQDYPEPIAAPPMKNEAEQGHQRGYFNPSNIVFHYGNYYSLIARTGFGVKSGRCLFRTTDVMAPNSWTVWDGDSYIPIFGSPYDHDWTPRRPCEGATGLHGSLGSIAKIIGTHMFAAFSLAASSENVENGFVDVSFSTDLLHWTDPRHIFSATPAWSKVCTKGERYSYPAVLSDTDQGRNFDSIGESSWLFITKMSCLHPLDRELVRFPVTIHLDASDMVTGH